MVDNVAITAGSGTTIAADDIGAGVLVQRVKTTWGPDGTANDADVATGKPLPVQVRSASGLIPIGEPTDAKSTATDTTSASGISIWKQISASIQAVATALGSTAFDLGVGTGGIRTLRVALDTSQVDGNEFEFVDASATAQVLGAIGATGDYISHLIIMPQTTSPGSVTLIDNATSYVIFLGGASSVSNLWPVTVDLGMISVSGAWKITTGANIKVIGVGNFT